MATVIDGESLAASLREELAPIVDQLARQNHRPCLATILMSADPASETYVSLKQDDCEELGIATRDERLDPDASRATLEETISKFNDNPSVDGILVQLPLPNHIDEREVLREVSPEKDVDGFHPENLGRLLAGNPRVIPCTPAAVHRILNAAGVDLTGAHVVVVGRGLVVGRPLGVLLGSRGIDATVTICHSKTPTLAEYTADADVVVAAAGVPELIDGDMLAPDAVVVDVGVNHVQSEANEQTLVGDVAFDQAKATVDAVTPVPGGVGPMTRAMLLYNTVQATARRAEIDVELP